MEVEAMDHGGGRMGGQLVEGQQSKQQKGESGVRLRGFAALSDDVLTSIVSFLHIRELASFSCVSRRFKEAVRKGNAWKHVALFMWDRVCGTAEQGGNGGFEVRDVRLLYDPESSYMDMCRAMPLSWPSQFNSSTMAATGPHKMRVLSTGPLALSVSFAGPELGGDRIVRADHPFPEGPLPPVTHYPLPLLPDHPPPPNNNTGSTGSGTGTGTPWVWAPLPPAPAPVPVPGLRPLSLLCPLPAPPHHRPRFAFMPSLVAYFEITIGPPPTDLPPQPQPQGQSGQHNQQSCIAIGLGLQDFPLVGKMPGWDGRSYGYHGDDGQKYHGRGMGHEYGPPFGVGDTVGCGLIYCQPSQLQRLAPPHPSSSFSSSQPPHPSQPSPSHQPPFFVPPPPSPPSAPHAPSHPPPLLAEEEDEMEPEVEEASDEDYSVELLDMASLDGHRPCTGSIFFTKNGQVLEMAFHEVRLSRPLYPMVGIDSHATVSANFGLQPFTLDLPHFQAQLLQHALPGASAGGVLTSALRQHPYDHPLHTDLWADPNMVRDEVEDGMPPVDFLQVWFNGLHPHHQDEDDDDYFTDDDDEDDEEEGSEGWDEEDLEEEESEGEEEEGMEGGEEQGGGDVQPMNPPQQEE